ncbi:MAG: DUF4293 family protein [Bacteroidales bacterium]|nr:DUF4293 family protein [Bacteroidales bacterium]
MWKRFQTLLLLIVSGLLLSMFLTDMCYVMVDAENGSGELVRYSIKFIDKSQFLIFIFTNFALSVITIAYFKVRMMQIRLCIMNSLLLLGFQIWIVVEYFKLNSVYTFTIFSIFPIISIILLLLAIKYIGRDEASAIANVVIDKYSKKNKTIK